MPDEPPRPERTFSIRQLCQEFKCTPRALRFYEDKGLLAPARRGQTRVYSQKDRIRLYLILQGKRVNLSLTEMREILDLYDRRDGGAAQTAAALRRLRERLADLEQQRVDLDQTIEALRETYAQVEEHLKANRPDLLADAEAYDRAVRARVDGDHGPETE